MYHWAAALSKVWPEHEDPLGKEMVSVLKCESLTLRF